MILEKLKRIIKEAEKDLESKSFNSYNIDINKRKEKLKNKFSQKNSRWIWIDEKEYALICHASMTYSFPDDENKNIITRRTSSNVYIIEIIDKEEKNLCIL